MEFVIVTGLSGSGKTTALNALEDIEYFCIDNLPLQLLLKFAEIFKEAGKEKKLALVIDVRVGEKFSQLGTYLDELRENGFQVKVLYLDSDQKVIIKRYKETRRKHPLSTDSDGDIELAVRTENEILRPIRAKADYYIDTSYLPAVKLKESILGFFLDDIQESMIIRCVSFGFKHGIPNDADLVFDVRCLPNPFYVGELKNKTGIEKEVQNYVLESGVAKELLKKLSELTALLIPEYIKEGKSQLIIAFGCTGGHHRSVTFAEHLSLYLTSINYRSSILHRDINK